MNSLTLPTLSPLIPHPPEQATSDIHCDINSGTSQDLITKFMGNSGNDITKLGNKNASFWFTGTYGEMSMLGRAAEWNVLCLSIGNLTARKE